MFDINKLANDLAEYVKNGVLTKENAETVYEAACIKYDINPETGESNVQESSDLDLINQFLEERAAEKLAQEAETTAPAEADPAKHVEDKIDEKLPTETPNEPNCIGCMKDVENTDKAIENAKKDLDVAGKLAEMKAAHEKEKDTTEEHKVIDQTVDESEEVDPISLTKLNIYESADAGIITAEEKAELLDILNSMNA